MLPIHKNIWFWYFILLCDSVNPMSKCYIKRPVIHCNISRCKPYSCCYIHYWILSKNFTFRMIIMYMHIISYLFDASLSESFSSFLLYAYSKVSAIWDFANDLFPLLLYTYFVDNLTAHAASTFTYKMVITSYACLPPPSLMLYGSLPSFQLSSRNVYMHVAQTLHSNKSECTLCSLSNLCLLCPV